MSNSSNKLPQSNTTKSSKQSLNSKKMIFLDAMLDLYHESEEALTAKDLSFQDKLNALSRISASQRAIYGKGSVHNFRSEANLGYFLNEHSEPELAIKHLNIAKSLSKDIGDIGEEESIKLAVETAGAYLTLDKKHTEQAEEIMKPYSDAQISSPQLRYKRDLVKSQICLSHKDYQNALQNLKSAQKSLHEYNHNEDTKEEAELFLKMSNIAEKGRNSIKNSYQKAQMYASNGQSILNKLSNQPNVAPNGQSILNKLSNQPNVAPNQNQINKDQNGGEKIVETEEENRVKFDLPQKPNVSAQLPKEQPQTSQQNENDELHELDNFEFIDEVIGEGAFGKVYKVKEKNGDTIYAAKISKKTINTSTDASSKSTKISLRREVSILSKLNHPAILKFICYSPVNFKNKPKPVIITEYAPNGTLYNLMKLEQQMLAKDDWTDTRKLIILYGVASAMSYLHSHKIVHRDLKPQNILMDSLLLPKIADFGLSKINHSNESMTMKSTIGAIKGTPLYIAPEIWEKQEYTEAGDVYAFGMIMFEMITAEQPFVELNVNEQTVFDIAERVKNGERPQFKYDIPDTYRILIERCWDQDPSKRPPFTVIVDELRNDPGFYTDNFEEDDYQDYIDFIDQYNTEFDETKREVDITKFINRESKTFRTISINVSKDNVEKKADQPKAASANTFLCPQDYLDKLDDDRRHLVEEAENDPIKQCIVGQFLVEGIEGFPQETDVGVQYLERAINAGCTEACCYYCNLLIRGQFVSLDLDLAKRYLETQLQSHDGTIYLLYGRVMRKFEDFDNARKYFRKGSNQGNNEAMYEYGKMMYRGEGCEKNEEEANVYFDLAKRNGNYKAYEFVFKQQKEEERKRKRMQAKNNA